MRGPNWVQAIREDWAPHRPAGVVGQASDDPQLMRPEDRPGWNLDWMRRANCTNKPKHWFFPVRESSGNHAQRRVAYNEAVARAKKVCAPCPVREECLYHAQTHDEHGIWGGTTSEERAVLARRDDARGPRGPSGP